MAVVPAGCPGCGGHIPAREVDTQQDYFCAVCQERHRQIELPWERKSVEGKLDYLYTYMKDLQGRF